MRKTILLLILFHLSKLALAQQLKINLEKQIGIDTIVNYDSITSDLLYKSIKKWAASNFENVKDITIYDTPEEIQFKYNQYIKSSLGGGWKIKGTFGLKIKDGKVKFELYKISFVTSIITSTFESTLLKKMVLLGPDYLPEK